MYYLALLFLLSPIDVPVPLLYLPGLHEATERVLRDHDCLGPTETLSHQITARSDKQYDEDWNWSFHRDWRNTFQRLLRNPIPHSGHAYKFRFNKRSVESLLKFNREVQETLEILIVVDPINAPGWGEVLAETKRLYGIWNHVDTICGNWSHLGMRHALQCLKELIGDRDFEQGILPPHVPVHLFREIK
jgi:hypothetical protein